VGWGGRVGGAGGGGWGPGGVGCGVKGRVGNLMEMRSVHARQISQVPPPPCTWFRFEVLVFRF